MANRSFHQFQGSLEPFLVNLFFQITFGVSGAPTLQTWDPKTRTLSTAGAKGARGAVSITRVSAGLFTITLQDTYNRFLGAGITFANSAAAAAPLQYWPTPNANLNASVPSIQVQFANASGVATDPGNGEIVIINAQFSNSSAL